MQQTQQQSQRSEAHQNTSSAAADHLALSNAAGHASTSAVPAVPAQTTTRVPDVPPQVTLWKDVSSAAQSTLTSLAILAATIWFLWRRQRFPHANVSHDIKYWYVEGRLVLHVAVAVSNVGDVVLRLKAMKMRVQQVLPTPEELRETIASGKDPVRDGETEILWPDIDSRECNWGWWHARRVEPDETEEFHFSFVLPAETKAVEVYTHIPNRRKRFNPVGWNTNTFWAFKTSGIFTPEDADSGTNASSKEIQ